MVDYGPTIDNLNIIIDKAKIKKDGVYSFRGIEYKVEKGYFTHYAHNGKILARYGHFNVVLGTYDGYSDNARKALKAIKEA